MDLLPAVASDGIELVCVCIAYLDYVLSLRVVRYLFQFCDIDPVV